VRRRAARVRNFIGMRVLLRGWAGQWLETEFDFPRLMIVLSNLGHPLLVA
jgi:hypothetical protein